MVAKKAQPPADVTIAGIDDLIRGLRDMSRDGLEPLELIKLCAEERALLAERSKVESRQDMLDDAIVRQHRKWHSLRRAILGALVQYPDAAAAVMRALEAEGA